MPMLVFPDTRQATEFDCGAAVVQGVLRYYGTDCLGAELIRYLHTDEEGTRARNIIGYLLHHGLSVRAGQMTIPELEYWIDRSIPVILDIQAWAEDAGTNYAATIEEGHYVVAIGYDEDFIYFEDPSLLSVKGKIPREELDARWHDRSENTYFEHFGIAVWGNEPQYDPSEVRSIQARVARRWLGR